MVLKEGEEREFFTTPTSSCEASCDTKVLLCSGRKVIDPQNPFDTAAVAKYNSASCSTASCSSCITPWGQSVVHGGKTEGFRKNELKCGQSCDPYKTTLTCINGKFKTTINGQSPSQFQYGECVARDCADCKLKSGDVVPHNKYSYLYTKEKVKCHTSCYQAGNYSYQRCTDGKFNQEFDQDKFQFSSCQTDTACARCVLPCTKNISSGASGFCYKKNAPSACGETCFAERYEFSCENGKVLDKDGAQAAQSLLDQYKQYSCIEKNACQKCTLPNGHSLFDGDKANFFKKATVTCGSSCISSDNLKVLTCSNGKMANRTLYPDFVHLSCREVCDDEKNIGRIEGETGGAPGWLCTLPWKTGVGLT